MEENSCGITNSARRFRVLRSSKAVSRGSGAKFGLGQSFEGLRKRPLFAKSEKPLISFPVKLPGSSITRPCMEHGPCHVQSFFHIRRQALILLILRRPSHFSLPLRFPRHCIMSVANCKLQDFGSQIDIYIDAPRPSSHKGITRLRIRDAAGSHPAREVSFADIYGASRQRLAS